MEKNFLYSIPIKNNEKKPNETYIYKNPLVKEIEWNKLYKKRTLHETYKKLLEDPNLEMIGYRKKNNKGILEKKFTWLKISQIFERAESIGSGLINLNLIEEKNDWKNINLKFIGMYSKNNINYLITDIALSIYGLTIVPLYDTLGEEATEYILNQTNLETIFISSENLKKVLTKRKEKNLYKNLKNVIILDDDNFDMKIKNEFSKDFIKIHFLEEKEVNLQSKNS